MLHRKNLIKSNSYSSNIIKIKTKIALLSSALLLAFSAQAADKNYDNLHKQLDIMNDIMLSSANVSKNSHQSLIRSIESVYLQGQGAIFTINSAHGRSSHRQFFQLATSLAPLAKLAPLAPLSPINGGERIIISNDDDLQEHELERVIEVFEQQRAGARELRNEQREIAYEIRDIERQRKDIEYQLQRGDKKIKDELTVELKNLAIERTSLNKNKSKLEQKVSELNKVRAEQKIAQSKTATFFST